MVPSSSDSIHHAPSSPGQGQSRAALQRLPGALPILGPHGRRQVPWLYRDGIFPDHRLNLCPLHWKVDSYSLYHQESLLRCNFKCSWIQDLYREAFHCFLHLTFPFYTQSLSYQRIYFGSFVHKSLFFKLFIIKYFYFPLILDDNSVEYGFLGFHGGSDGKESACNAADLGLVPGLGRFPVGENGYPVQYSCLENSMNSSPICQLFSMPLWGAVWGVAPWETGRDLCAGSLLGGALGIGT